MDGPEKTVIYFSPFWCSFGSPLPPEIEQGLYEALAFQSEGYFYAPAYQSHAWDGYTRLYHLTTRRFRVGMLTRVIQFLKEHDIEVEVLNHPPAKTFVQRSKTYALRPYQARAMADIVGQRFGILQAPMRSGKTMLYIATIDSESEFPSVFFCRSLDLAYQTLERLNQFLPNVKAGLVGDNKIDIQDVTVITIQSAFSAYKKKCDEKDLPEEKDIESDENKSKVRNLLQKAKIVFYDEFHHAQSKTSRFILDKCVHATMKIGLSATPFTGEASDLLTEEIAGPVIHKISYSELIEEGFLLRPFIYMYTLPEIKIPKDTPYPTVYKMAVTDNDYLTGLIKKLVDTLTDMGKSVVVQTEFISHTKKLADALGSASLTGKERDMHHRVKVKKQLENKEILCLVSTLFEEGLDVPTLDYTINAAGGLSNIGTLQRMRSITGNVKGKTTCGIIDFFHQCKYLERHSKVRRMMYQSEPEFVLEERDVSDLSLEEVE